MHDNQLEDHIRSILRREGDDLTLNITAQELERRLALRRRERAGRLLSLVAAGIAVVAIGGIVVAGNGWFGTGPSVGGKPVGSTATAGPTAPDSSAPGPSASPSAVASLADGALGCVAVDPSASRVPPGVVAGVVPGDSMGFGGTVVAARWNGVDSGSPGTWVGLPDDPASVKVHPDQVIEITSDGCFQSVSAAALLTVYAQAPAVTPTPVALTVIGGIGARVVDIEPPSTGGWTVRVRTSFVTTDGSEAWSETLYRVVVPFHPPQLLGNNGRSPEPWAEGMCASYTLSTGASAADQCAAPYEPIAANVQPHAVAKGTSMVFELAAPWLIDQARVTAVDAAVVAAGSFAPEYSVAFIDPGGPRITVPENLDPGTWIVRVSLKGSHAGDSFDAYYDFPIIVTR